MIEDFRSRRMLKSLLIGLDGSNDCSSVLELGLRWAKRFGALAVGVGAVDEPGIIVSEAMLFAGGDPWPVVDLASPLIVDSRQRVRQILDHFVERCGEVGVTCKRLEVIGSPYVQILRESQRFDLILLSQETHFDYGHEDSADETLRKVIRDTPRPVVAVPKTLSENDAVLVAYDGSLQASRALYAFQSSGLGRGCKVHVVSVASDSEEAARHAGRALDFLHPHGIDAILHPVATTENTAEILLKMAHHLKAGLLVIGAYGQPVLREFFLGSVTRTILAKSPVPVFCYH
jgi:nucleotide-binding universal stress UspA family protein